MEEYEIKTDTGGFTAKFERDKIFFEGYFKVSDEYKLSEFEDDLRQLIFDYEDWS